MKTKKASVFPGYQTISIYAAVYQELAIRRTQTGKTFSDLIHEALQQIGRTT